MKQKFDRVYQFKIMQDTKPPIWRRIQVPETYTFYNLHGDFYHRMALE